jgi:hypothetical protein
MGTSPCYFLTLTPMNLRSALCFAFALLSLAAHADVTLRPGDKPKESTKDFKKDKERNGYPSPEPRDRAFAYVTGLSVVVELEVATSYMGPVKFSIKDQPQHGTLSEIRPHPSGASNRAVVTYTNVNTDALVDRFTFQGKVGEASTSIPGTIGLMGKKSAPRLEVLEAPKFKRLQPGDQDAGRVVVLNAGTAPYSAELTWPAPFIGPPRLELAVNEKQTFMLMIRPEAPGAYRVDQELQPGAPTSRVIAYLECIQAFVVTPGVVNLQFDASKGNRVGVVKVSNGSPAPLTLRLEFSKRLLAPKELVLEPKQTQELRIAMDAADVAAFRGELLLVQEPHREKVIVYAEPEPAQIRLASPVDGKVDFGKVEKGKKGQAMISIANDGGQPAVLKFMQSPPFTLANGEGSAVVPPGQALSVALGFAAEQPGSYKSSFGIAGSGGKLDVAVSGTLFDPRRPGTAGEPEKIENPHGPARPKAVAPAAARDSATKPTAKVKDEGPVTPKSLSKPPAPTPAPALAASLTTPPSVASGDDKDSSGSEVYSKMSPKGVALFGQLATFGLGIDAIPQLRSAILDPVPAIGVKEAGKNYVVLQWQSPKVEPKSYLVQESFYVVNKQTGIPLKSWKNVEGWEPVTVPAGTSAARIEGLLPETQYEWRVLGVDNEGKFSPPSDLLQVSLPAAFSLPGWAWQMIIGLVVVLAVLMVRRAREQRAFKV